MIKRLAFGLLATASFVVVPATAASAWGGVADVREKLPVDSCDLHCSLEQLCVGHDETLDGRVCTPFSQSETVKMITTAVDQNI